MAGDWIPMQTDLANRLEVSKISVGCDCTRFEAVGMLLHFWGWVSNETVDGVVDVPVDALVDVLCLPRVFFLSMSDAGWLSITDNRVTVPKFERWMSEGAKVRLQKTMRQKRWRAGVQNVDAHVDGTTSTKASTTEQNSITHTQATDLIAGTRLDTPEFRAAWGKYLLHILSARGRAINDIEAQTVLASISQTGAEKGVADIEFSILKGAKSLLDSSNDFQKPRNGTARKPVTAGGKQRFVDVTTYQGGGPTHD